MILHNNAKKQLHLHTLPKYPTGGAWSLFLYLFSSSDPGHLTSPLLLCYISKDTTNPDRLSFVNCLHKHTRMHTHRPPCIYTHMYKYICMTF